MIYPNAKSDKPINTIVLEDQPEQTTSMTVSKQHQGWRFYHGDQMELLWVPCSCNWGELW